MHYRGAVSTSNMNFGCGIKLGIVTSSWLLQDITIFVSTSRIGVEMQELQEIKMKILYLSAIT